MSENLTEILIVLKGPRSLEVCAGIYFQNKPEDHPYIKFIQRHGNLKKIIGWNLIQCETEENWIDKDYFLVEHIYKRGSEVLEMHKDRTDILSALEELNKIEEKIERKISVLT
ncbi:hypothetical protein HY837_02135 [archaeon]|nr:hypothetical protein [archaeon]